MKRISVATVFCAIFFLFSSLENAQPAYIDGADMSSGDSSFSLTISPLHLFLPMLELTGEFRMGEKLGFALIGGYGKPKLTITDSFGNESEKTLTAYEFGFQYNYYLIGGFSHGLQIGVEGLWLKVDGDYEDIDLQGQGISFSPFIGYKVIFDSGITLNGQIGIQKIFVSANADDGNSSASDSDSDTSVMLNLNVGMSF